MASYASMEEPDTYLPGEVLFAESMFSKFCYFGFVGTTKWDITYIVLFGDGVIRVYDSEETYRMNPENFVYQLDMTSQHLPSSSYSKDYSKDSSNPIVIHYCYILKDNGLVAAGGKEAVNA